MTALLLNPLASAVASTLDVSQPLPTYSRTRPTDNEWDVPEVEQDHHFHLTHKKTGTPWLTLTIRSRAASEAEPPTFYQGAEIAGSVKMELDREEFMDDIFIALYGRLTVFTRTATTPSNFLFMSRKLYAASEDTSTTALKRGRLRGKYDWPFSFRLPKGVTILMSSAVLGKDGDKKRFRLPPTFVDDEAGVHIEYLLSVRANRGGFKANSKLVVPFKYIPLARPSAPTILRQLAYQQSIPLLGPEDDPDGWKMLDRVKIEGTLFKTIPVEAHCTMSLTRPLTYTRGAPMHLQLAITSSNPQFLDLLHPDASLHVALVQHLRFGDDVAFWPRFSQRIAPQQIVKSYERAAASWWYTTTPLRTSRDPPHAEHNPNERVFAGELMVPEELVPACEVLHYSHEYQLVLYPPTAVGFVPSAPPKKALLVEEVSVVTAFAQAPRPCSYASPRYAAASGPV